MKRPAGVHDLDWMAHQLYERLGARTSYLQKKLAGPAPVGKRKMNASQWARQLTKMTAGQTAQLLTQMPERNPIMSTALDKLGGHGLALLPYLQPAGTPYPPTDEGVL